VRVEIHLFATLTSYLPPGAREGIASIEVPDTSTVRDVVQRLGIPVDLERVTLVNGGDATPERRLSPGDVVTVFPPLSGGRR
jgi:molybdopterin converting factor small subunit